MQGYSSLKSCFPCWRPVSVIVTVTAGLALETSRSFCRVGMVSLHECWQPVFKFGMLHAQVLVSPDSMAFRVSSNKTDVFWRFSHSGLYQGQRGRHVRVCSVDLGEYIIEDMSIKEVDSCSRRLIEL